MNNTRRDLTVLIMAGGRGERLGGVIKPLTEICGRPMIQRMLDVAKALGNVYLALSKYTIALMSLCNTYRCILTEGRGYPEDLAEALRDLKKPVLILPTDTPFISVDLLKIFVEKALSIDANIVTLRRCRNSVCEPFGISLFKHDGDDWANVDIPYSYEVMDIDTIEDLRRAEDLCVSMEGGPR